MLSATNNAELLAIAGKTESEVLKGWTEFVLASKRAARTPSIR
ncbi:MAG: hypothetical protein ABGY29_16975 [bacterium]